MKGQVVDKTEAADIKAKAYRAPQLVVFGDMVELTASGSKGYPEGRWGNPWTGQGQFSCEVYEWFFDPGNCRNRRS